MKFLLALFAIFVAVDASANLLVRKALLSKYPTAGEENVFEYQIVNKGSSAALNVQLDDRKSFPTDRFEIRRGSLVTKFSVIPANASVHHHVVIVPLQPQEIVDKDGFVDYINEDSGEHARAKSFAVDTSYNTVYASPKALSAKIGLTRGQLIGFLFIVLPITSMTGVLYYLGARRYPTSQRASKRRQ